MNKVLPTKDRLDGVLLVGDDAVHLRAADPDLSAVDIIDCPNLELLDLSGIQGEVHVSVRGCPHLHYLRLPTGSCGAVVHLDLDRQQTGLRLDGPIGHLDWCRGACTGSASAGQQPFEGALIVFGATLPAPGPQVLVVLPVSGGVAPARLDFPVGVRTLHVEGLRGVRQLAGPTPLEQVVLHDLPDLEEIALSHDLGTLQLTGCPRLRAITGSGRALRVHRSAQVPRLSVVGSWPFACFREVKAVLDGPLIAQTTSHASPNIIPSMQTLANASAPLGAAADAGLLADPAWRAAASRWVQAAPRANSILPALRLLKDLLAAGEDPFKVWGLRTGMALRFAHRQLPGMPRAWSWPTDLDVSRELWETDLLLWLALRAAHAAPGHEEILRQGVWPIHWLSLVRILPHAPDLADVLAQTLQPQPPSLSSRIRQHPSTYGQLIDLVEALLRLPRDLPAGRLACLIAPRMPAIAAPEQAVGALTALVVGGCQKARETLLQAAGTEAWSAVAMRARLAAVVPARTDRLSDVLAKDACA